MKKILVIIGCLFVLLLTWGCQNKQIELVLETTTLNVGDVMDVKVNNSEDFVLTCEQQQIVTIIDNKQIVALQKGTANIVVKDKKTNETSQTTITVVGDNYVLSHNIKSAVRVGEVIEFTIVLNEEAEYHLTKSNDLVTIEGNKITALNTGVCLINVVTSSEVVATIPITISEKLIDCLEYPEIIDIESTYLMAMTVKEGHTLKLISENESIITIDGLKLIASSSGTTTITVLVDGESYESFNVSVVVPKYTITVQNEISQATVGDVYTPIINVTPKGNYNIVTSNNVSEKDGSFTFTASGDAKFSVVVQNAVYSFTVKVYEELTSKDILEWALEKVGTGAYIDIDFPTTHPDYPCTITWSSPSPDIDIEKGELEFIEYDEDIALTCEVEYLGVKASKTVTFTIYGYVIQDLAEAVARTLRPVAMDNIELVTSDEKTNAVITWQSSNEKIISNSGQYSKPMIDQTVTLSYTISVPESQNSHTFTKEVLVIGYSLNERIELAQAYLFENIIPNKTIDATTVLPSSLPQFYVELEWFDLEGEALDLNSLPATAITGNGTYIVLKITDYNGAKMEYNLFVNFQAKPFTDKWEAIQLFLDTINPKTITNQRFYLYGFEQGYLTVPSQNIGYIPFYHNNDSEIIQAIVDPSITWVRSNMMKTSTEYIVIHNTGSASPTATAKQLSYYINNMAQSEGPKSWHFTVDDNEVYQHLPKDEVGWHAGDGSTTFPNTWDKGLGGGNRNGIGIETCCYKGIDFNDAMRNLAKLVAELLIEYNLGFDRIKQHYDFSGKDCPQVIRSSNRWNELMNLIQLEYFAKLNLQGVTFTWKSLTPNVLDDNGRVINHTGEGTVVEYEVTVTYEKVTKKFTYSSVLEALK